MKTVKLGDICDLMTGGTPSKGHPEYFNEGTIRWLVSGDIHQGNIYDCEGRITEAGLNNSNAKFLPVNSVMIALNGQGKTRATVAMLRTEATCNQSLVSIFPKDSTSVLPEWIYWNLKGRYSELRRITGDSGNDRRGLNMIILRNIELPKPPSLEDQRRIAARLDAEFKKIDRSIDLTEKNISNVQNLFANELVKAFRSTDNTMIELKRICNFKNGFAFKSSTFKHNGLPVLRISNIQQDVLSHNKLVFIDTGDYKENLVDYFVRPGDLVIAMSGATTGKVAINTTDESYLQNQRVGRFIPSSELHTRFLFYLLKTKAKENLQISKGSAQPNISTEQIKSILVPDISFNQQVDISNRLDDLSSRSLSLQRYYTQKVSLLLSLKQSLLAQAFSEGEVQ